MWLLSLHFLFSFITWFLKVFFLREWEFFFYCCASCSSLRFFFCFQWFWLVSRDITSIWNFFGFWKEDTSNLFSSLPFPPPLACWCRNWEWQEHFLGWFSSYIFQIFLSFMFLNIFKGNQKSRFLELEHKTTQSSWMHYMCKR
jgi:hypothetical protein